MTRLDEIAKEIRKLEAEREALLRETKKEEDEFIRSLKWTGDCAAYLNIDPDPNKARYSLTLVGSSMPRNGRTITIFGNDPRQRFNLTWNCDKTLDYDVCYLKTDCPKLFMQLLSVANFKKFQYNLNDLDVMSKALEVEKRISKC